MAKNNGSNSHKRKAGKIWVIPILVTHTYIWSHIHNFILTQIYRIAKKLISVRKINIANIKTKSTEH